MCIYICIHTNIYICILMSVYTYIYGYMDGLIGRWIETYLPACGGGKTTQKLSECSTWKERLVACSGFWLKMKISFHSVCQLPFSWWSLLACWTSTRFRAQKSIGLMKQISIHLISWHWYQLMHHHASIFDIYMFFHSRFGSDQAGWIRPFSGSDAVSPSYPSEPVETAWALGPPSRHIQWVESWLSWLRLGFNSWAPVNLMNFGAWWSLFARLHGFFNGVRLHGKQS